MSLAGSRRKYFRREARNIIFADWLTQIIAFAVVGAVFVGVSSFGVAAFQLAKQLFPKSTALVILPFAFYVCSVLLTIPMLYGVVGFEIKAFERRESRVSDIFSAFSDVEIINRSYKLFVSFAARLVLPFAPSAALMYFVYNYYFSGIFGFDVRLGSVDVIYFSLCAAAVVLCLWAFVFCAKYFVGLYIAVKRTDLPVSKCFYLANVCMLGRNHELFLLAVSLVPLLVLSLFTMGFLLIMYALPYVVLCFVGFSSFAYMYEVNEGQTHNMLHNSDSLDDDNSAQQTYERTAKSTELHFSEENTTENSGESEDNNNAQNQ